MHSGVGCRKRASAFPAHCCACSPAGMGANWASPGLLPPIHNRRAHRDGRPGAVVRGEAGRRQPGAGGAGRRAPGGRGGGDQGAGPQGCAQGCGCHPGLPQRVRRHGGRTALPAGLPALPAGRPTRPCIANSGPMARRPAPPSRREELVGVPTILRYVARAGGDKGAALYGSDPLSAAQVRPAGTSCRGGGGWGTACRAVQHSCGRSARRPPPPPATAARAPRSHTRRPVPPCTHVLNHHSLLLHNCRWTSGWTSAPA